MGAKLVAAELLGMGCGYIAERGRRRLWHRLASADECIGELLEFCDLVIVYDTANALEEYANDPRVIVHVVASWRAG